jgi:hypothetical protein
MKNSLERLNRRFHMAEEQKKESMNLKLDE